MSGQDRLAEAPPEFTHSSTLLEEAFELARCAHEGQERKDPGSPYVIHPTLVAQRLSELGYRDEVVAAALLHDVVEDSELTVEEVMRRFGWTVADLVATLTDDPEIDDFEESKEAQRQRVAGADRNAQAIFAADRISNARELTRLLRERRPSAAERDKTNPHVRLRLWEADLEMLEQAAPDLDLLPELRHAVAEFGKVVRTVCV